MYLFISTDQHLKKFKDCTCDYLHSNNLITLKKRVLAYADKYAYPKDQPKGSFIFRKKYGAVKEKYCNDIIGWIIKL